METMRHGDLLIRKVTALPKGLKKVTSVILAEGEHTGHKHVLQAVSRETILKMFKENQELYVEVSGGDATVTHEEHKPLVLAPGKYQIGIAEREFDYALNDARKVQD